MDPGTILAVVIAALVLAVVALSVARARRLEARRRVSLPPPARSPEPAPLPPAVEPQTRPATSPHVELQEPSAAKAPEPPSPTAPREPARGPAPREDPGPSAPATAPADAAREVPAALPTPEKARPAADGRERVDALKKGLASTRGGFIARLARIFGGKTQIDPALLDQIQEVLITADIGLATTEKMLARLRDRLGRRELESEDAVWQALREEASAILGESVGGVRCTASKRPLTILVVGVNGVGKTTTIGKLASIFRQDGKNVVLAAGDTFRAAAVLQLEVWARRVGCAVVKGKDRADPASVVFDAIKKAQADGADVVIADTAGRLHTKSNLMEELKKVVRTAEKALERPVDEILLVLDATTGQNALQQAQLFKDSIPVSGIVLTKLDGTAKGGVVLGIVHEHRIPVRYVGVGERVEDLREFDTESFVQALFAKPDEETAAA